MARTKKSESVPVRIRFKQLKDGNQSIYLDIYTDRKRRYEFLKLFLVPEISQEAKERNANTLKAANAIKAQRILDITNKKPVTVLSDKARMSLIEWLDEYADFGTKKGRTSLADNVHAVSLCLKAYNPRIRLYEVDKDFLQGFIDYLGTRKTKVTKRPLAKKPYPVTADIFVPLSIMRWIWKFLPRTLCCHLTGHPYRGNVQSASI